MAYMDMGGGFRTKAEDSSNVLLKSLVVLQ